MKKIDKMNWFDRDVKLIAFSDREFSEDFNQVSYVQREPYAWTQWVQDDVQSEYYHLLTDRFNRLARERKLLAWLTLSAGEVITENKNQFISGKFLDIIREAREWAKDTVVAKFDVKEVY